MDPARFTRVNDTTWRIEPSGGMRVPGIIYADEALIRDMDDKVYTQTANVAMLPGIVRAAYVMPDAHWGYGFPIGGVAAFDPEEGGIISAGGVGFDISCGVRSLLTGVRAEGIRHVQKPLADSFSRQIPAGVGSEGSIALDPAAMEAMLAGGARWAIEQGWARPRTSNESRKTSASPEPARISFPSAPKPASARRWEHSAQAIIILKSKPSYRVSARPPDPALHRSGPVRLLPASFYTTKTRSGRCYCCAAGSVVASSYRRIALVAEQRSWDREGFSPTS